MPALTLATTIWLLPLLGFAAPTLAAAFPASLAIWAAEAHAAGMAPLMLAMTGADN
jgi:hypothetical protein